MIKDLYICFVNNSKAFDNVKHDKLIETLQDIGVDHKHIRIVVRPCLYLLIFIQSKSLNKLKTKIPDTSR